MYGEGNSSKLVGDIIGSTTKVTDGLSAATGVDLRALLAGFLGGKAAAPAANNTPSDDYTEYVPDNTGYYSDIEPDMPEE